MKTCLIIINNNAGGSNKISFKKVEECLGKFYKYSHLNLPTEKSYSLDNFNAVAVCGGDGTFSSLLEKVYNKKIEFYYFPAGTLNDKAKAERYGNARRDCVQCKNVKNVINFDVVEKNLMSNYEPLKEIKYAEDTIKRTISNNSEINSNFNGKYIIGQPIVIGKANDKIFSYVLASGSFTPIGYKTNQKIKQKIGILAYIFNIFKEYKIHQIPAEIECDGEFFKGEYTLIMFLKSSRCFGFRFNFGYKETEESGHLIAIKAPKHNGILGKIEMFFPFFRVFFIGLKKERLGKIIYIKTKNTKLTLNPNTLFCKDGEKQTFSQPIDINFEKTVCNVSIINKY